MPFEGQDTVAVIVEQITISGPDYNGLKLYMMMTLQSNESLDGHLVNITSLCSVTNGLFTTSLIDAMHATS